MPSKRDNCSLIGQFPLDLRTAIFTFFLQPDSGIFQNLEIGLPSIAVTPDQLRKEIMDAVHFLLAIAAFLVPLMLAWLFINRK